MSSKIVWNKCKCGQWCMAKTNIADIAVSKTLKGIQESDHALGKLGADLGKSIFGENGKNYAEKTGKLYGKIPVVGQVVGGVVELIRGDNVIFKCEKCGNKWSWDNSKNNQNLEYAKELKSNFMSLQFSLRKNLFICDEIGYVPQSFRVLAITDIPEDLEFPEGHPIVNTFYKCHPYRTNIYYPVDSYEIKVLEDELLEFKRIMVCLGASHFEFSAEYEGSETTKKSKEQNVNVEGNKECCSGKGSLDTENRSKTEKIFKTTFQGKTDYEPQGEPALPHGLIWYNNRDDWKQKCEFRLEGRTVHDEFTFSSFSSVMTSDSERQQIETELKTLVSSLKGGVSTKMSSYLKKNDYLTMKVSVDFHPMSVYEQSPKSFFKRLMGK